MVNVTKKKLFSLCLTLSLTAVLLVGCGSKATDAMADCPFSELEWTSSVKDMEAAEGTEHETYESVYGGTTYAYAKEYQGITGTVKYMFDESEKLASIAWAYGSESTDELYELYETVHADIVDAYGESSYNTQKETNYGDVWYREGGNIILSTMLTDSQKAFQLAFVSPDHSAAESDRKQSSKQNSNQ